MDELNDHRFIVMGASEDGAMEIQRSTEINGTCKYQNDTKKRLPRFSSCARIHAIMTVGLYWIIVKLIKLKYGLY